MKEHNYKLVPTGDKRPARLGRERMIRGACEFSPDAVERMRIKGRDRNASIGAGELEFGFADGRRVVRPARSRRKFTRAELREVCDSITFKEPALALGSRLVLLELGPHRAHAYWEVSYSTMEELRRKRGGDLGGAALTLRFYEMSRDRMTVLNNFDIDVQGLKSNWFTEFWEGGKLYLAELGFRFSDGAFERLVRSNIVELPRSEAVAEETTDFLHINSNRTLPRKPDVPSIFEEDNELVGRVRIDNHYIDLEAEAVVRRIYLQVAEFGPKILEGREPVNPASFDRRIELYRERKRARARFECDNDSNNEMTPLQGKSDAKAQLQPKEQPERNESDKHEVAAKEAEPAMNEKACESVNEAQKRAETRKMILNAERVKSPLLMAMITADGVTPFEEVGEKEEVEEMDVLKATSDEAPEFVEVGAVAEQSAEARPVAMAAATEGVQNSSQDDSFLGGLGLEEKPEPPRYWGSRPAGKAKAKKKFAGDWTKISNDEFNAGIDLSEDKAEKREEKKAEVKQAEAPAPKVEAAKTEKPAKAEKPKAVAEERSQEEKAEEELILRAIATLHRAAQESEKSSSENKPSAESKSAVKSASAQQKIEEKPKTEKQPEVRKPEIKREEKRAESKSVTEKPKKDFRSQSVSNRNSGKSGQARRESRPVVEKKVEAPAKTAKPQPQPVSSDIDTFSITANITLSGTIPAGATLMIGGREIRPRPDGTYAIECSFREGNLDIPYELKGPNGGHSGRSGEISLGMKHSTPHYDLWDKLSVVED